MVWSQFPTEWRTTAEPMNPAPPVTRMRLGIVGSSVMKRRHQILERPELTVFVRQDRLVELYRPGNVQARIVPDHTALGCWRIITVHLIGYLGVRLERAKTMSEALRHENLFTAFRADFLGHPLSIGRRFEPQINHNIED